MISQRVTSLPQLTGWTTLLPAISSSLLWPLASPFSALSFCFFFLSPLRQSPPPLMADLLHTNRPRPASYSSPIILSAGATVHFPVQTCWGSDTASVETWWWQTRDKRAPVFTVFRRDAVASEKCDWQRSPFHRFRVFTEEAKALGAEKYCRLDHVLQKAGSWMTVWQFFSLNKSSISKVSTNITTAICRCFIW